MELPPEMVGNSRITKKAEHPHPINFMTTEEKRARFEQMKAWLRGGARPPEVGETIMDDPMPPQFKVSLEGEDYIVGRKGRNWCIQHIDSESGKQITEDLAKQYWEVAKK